MNHASWLRATVAIAFAACALAALAGCASPKVEVEQSQVQSDFEATEESLVSDGVLVQSPYVNNDDYALTAFDVSDSHVADDGANVFNAKATFEQRLPHDGRLATYAKDGDSYVPNFEASNASTKAVSGIVYDPQGTLSSSDLKNIQGVDFDEEAQTRAPFRWRTSPNGLKVCRAM